MALLVSTLQHSSCLHYTVAVRLFATITQNSSKEVKTLSFPKNLGTKSLEARAILRRSLSKRLAT